MSDTVTQLREQVRESTYSSDRESAIEQLSELYAEVGEGDRDSIGRTLAEVAVEATYGDERRLAQSALDDLFREGAPGIERYAIRAHRRLALDGDRSAERERALDRLREYQAADLPAEQLESIHETYEEIIEGATHESERRRARDALADLEAQAATGSDRSDGEESGSYLAVSLTEHLDAAREESPEACLERLEELTSFVEETPVDDSAYESVLEDLRGQRRQLESAPTGDDLDEERSERIARLAERVRRLYLRDT